MNAGEFARKRAAIDRRARGRQQFARRALEHLVADARAVRVAAGGKFIGYKLPDGSVACEKKRYRDEQSARLELERIAMHGGGWRVPVRAYECEFCCGWHLTARVTWSEYRTGAEGE